MYRLITSTYKTIGTKPIIIPFILSLNASNAIVHGKPRWLLAKSNLGSPKIGLGNGEKTNSLSNTIIFSTDKNAKNVKNGFHQKWTRVKKLGFHKTLLILLIKS